MHDLASPAPFGNFRCDKLVVQDLPIWESWEINYSFASKNPERLHYVTEDDFARLRNVVDAYQRPYPAPARHQARDLLGLHPGQWHVLIFR